MEVAAVEENDVYTNDGTTDFHRKPANKQKTGKWKACRYILITELCERMAFYGMSTNLVNFLIAQYNQGNAAASKIVLNWVGTCYLTPLIGAFMADSYLGKYCTIAIFSIIYVVGMTLMTLLASVKGLKPILRGGVAEPTTWQMVVLYTALYLTALGTGGIKPCVSSFGADQFDENDEKEKRNMSSFFNWFYLSINIGALFATSVLVWVQMNVGWGWGFGFPAIAMAIAVAAFFFGSSIYRLQIAVGSPLTRLVQVLVASVRKYSVRVPEDKSLLYETSDAEPRIQGFRKLVHTDKLWFLDKAAVKTNDDDTANVNPWKLCTLTQVEELKAMVGILPVWVTGIIFAAVYCQISTMFVIQGNTMDPHLGRNFKIPSASLALFAKLSVIICVPLYDHIIVHIARKCTGHERGFTTLQRMGIGMVVSILAMTAAGTLEVIRLEYVRKNNYYDLPVVPMSIFWQVPQYFLVGTSEVFTFIGEMEFFYDQAPDSLRSMCSAFSHATTALGSYLSSLLVTIVTDVTTRKGKRGWIPDNLNRGHLDYFFWLVTLLCVINFLSFLLIAKWYVYKKVADQKQ